MTEIIEIERKCVTNVLWREVHVGIITVVEYNKDNIISLELSEASQLACRRWAFTRKGFSKLMTNSFS